MKTITSILFGSLLVASLIEVYAITSEKTLLSSIKTNNDLNQICQLALNLPELDPYFQKDKFLKSKSLSVLKNQDILESMPLTKFGKQVKFVSSPNKTKQDTPYIEFFNVSIEGQKASMMFIYPNERIDGVISFTKNNKDWKVSKLEFTEF